MQGTDLTGTERAVAAACATGSEVDVAGRPEPAVDGTVAIRGSTSTGLVSFAGATIGGSLVMRGTHLAGPGIALDGPSPRV